MRNNNNPALKEKLRTLQCVGRPEHFGAVNKELEERIYKLLHNPRRGWADAEQWLEGPGCEMAFQQLFSQLYEETVAMFGQDVAEDASDEGVYAFNKNACAGLPRAVCLYEQTAEFVEFVGRISD